MSCLQLVAFAGIHVTQCRSETELENFMCGTQQITPAYFLMKCSFITITFLYVQEELIFESLNLIIQRSKVYF